MNGNQNADDGRGYVLSDEDYGPFDGFSRTEFERWLVTGMRSYFQERRGPEAFSGADGFIRRRDYLVEGLEDVYREWSVEQQGWFRAALADVLASLSPLPQNVIIFEHLLSLAAALNAVEILRVLPIRIGADDFGRMIDSDGERLFDVAILAVARLSGPREDALSCLRALVGSKHFDAAYSGTALLALCRTDAKGLPNHLELLRGALTAMFREYDSNSEVRRALAQEILDTIGMEYLSNALAQLSYQGDGGGSDAWLADALLFGDGAPVDYGPVESGGILLWRRGTHDIRVKVPAPSVPSHTPLMSKKPKAKVDAWTSFGVERIRAEKVLADSN
jgi:hypothetical protein